MKRKTDYDYSFENPCDPSTISPHLLQALGKAIVLWNDVEFQIDQTMVQAAEIPASLHIQVSSRINGFDGKVEIIKSAIGKSNLYEISDKTTMLETIGALAAYKSARDAIAHARLSNDDGGIVPTYERRGDQFEVLVTEDSLNILSDHLVVVRNEMAFVEAFITIHEIQKRVSEEDVGRQFLPQLQQVMARLRHHQEKRKALKPLPKLPEVQSNRTKSKKMKPSKNS